MKHLALLSVLLVLAPAVAAQAPESRDLPEGRSISAVLETGEAHEYVLELDSAWFVSGRVQQDEVAVTITVLGPDGERVGRFSSPVDVPGPELFRLSTAAAGPHRVQVAARNPDEGGRYRIVLERSEPVATTPEGTVDQALAAFAPDTPGAVIGVIEGGELRFVRSAGAANLTHGVPFGPDTPTNIGSTSKQFTGFAIALLAERGLLSLDDDVRKHIPELPDFGEPITLRHLLTHQSGYREFVNLLLLEGRRVLEGDYIERDEIIRIVQNQPELQNPPGTEYNYNNTAFGLLTIVVERVTGDSFPDWMAREVFGPLGMTRTRVLSDPTEVIPGRAYGYAPGPGGFREVRDLHVSMGAGGIYTTPGDLARWMGNLGSGELGGPEVVQKLTTRSVLASGDTTSYGLGIFVDRNRGLTRWQHGGSDVAHRSTFVYYPDLDAGYVVLSNHAASPGSLGNLVAEAFFGGRMTERTAASRGGGPGGSPSPQEGEEDAPEPVDLTAFEGVYFSEELETFYRFEVDGDRLALSHRRFGPVALEHQEGDRFSGGLPVTDVHFQRDEAGEVTGVRVGNGRARDVLFERR